jgi:hypothetical protein
MSGLINLSCLYLFDLPRPIVIPTEIQDLEKLNTYTV